MKNANLLPTLILSLIISFLISPVKASFSEGLCGWQHSGKWGFIDTSGKPAIPFIWDNVGEFQNGVASVQKNGKWGLINKKCEVVVPLTWDKIEGAYFGGIYGNLGILRVCLKEKWGLIDTHGKVLIEPVWDKIENPFSAGEIDENLGILKVCLGEKWGLIDKSGKILVEPAWGELRGFQGGVSPVRIGIGDKIRWGFINSDGRVVEKPDRWISVNNFIDGRYEVFESSPSIRRPVFKHIKYENGRMVIDDAYQEEKHEAERRMREKLVGMGFDVNFVREEYGEFRKEGKSGVVNSEGVIIVPAEWDSVEDLRLVNDGLLLVRRDNKFGCYDLKGKLVIPAEWESNRAGSSIHFNGDYAIVKRDGKVGVIDKTGRVVISVEWDDIGGVSSFKDPHFAIVVRGGKMGMVNSSNRIVVNAEWDRCDFSFADGLLLVTRDDKIGFSNDKAELVIPLGGFELGKFLIHEREWRDIEGRAMRASALRIEGKNVIFSIKNKEVAFSLQRLCDSDRKLLALATEN